MKYALAALVLFSAAPVVAQTPSEFAMATCPSFGDIARVIMQKRQEGMLMSDNLQLMETGLVGVEGVEDWMREAITGFVYGAYNEPQWATERNQVDAVNRFHNGVEAECFQILAAGQ